MPADQLVELVQTKVPHFNSRPMTFEDFLSACEGEGIAVEIRKHLFDEELCRDEGPTIIVNSGLSERYRTFVGFHSFAHWLAHPGPNRFYLGSPGWLSHIEIEASTIGLLALVPHPKGPPYPRLVKAKIQGEQLQLWVEYPDGEQLWVEESKPAAKIRRETRWRTKRVTVARVEQTEFEWRGEG